MSIFWPRKVFEGVHSHVMNFLRICDFVPDFYFESGPKLQIQTIKKWAKIAFWHVIWIKSANSERVKRFFISKLMIMSKYEFGPLFNSSNLQFWIRFEIKTWTKIAFSKQAHHVIMNSFIHFSGPRNRPQRAVIVTVVHIDKISKQPVGPLYVIQSVQSLSCWIAEWLHNVQVSSKCRLKNTYISA